MDARFHHGHDHAQASQHSGGHHLLQVEKLNVSFRMYDPDDPRFFRARQRDVRVIDGLGVSVHEGEIVAIVGASGSGKTLLADCIMGLFEPNAIVSGVVWFDGRLQDASSLAELRGNGISLVPQSVTHLDPLMKVGRQVEGEPRDGERRADRARRRRELFKRYGLGESVAQMYPHQLSGGMARRVLLCCALMDNPRVIVADEPTPGLDLDLAVRALEDFRIFADDGNGVLLITHDVELALRVADRIAVFKGGTVVEETAVENFAFPERLRHPFSRALSRCVCAEMASVSAGFEEADMWPSSSPCAGDTASGHVGVTASAPTASAQAACADEPYELGGARTGMLEARGISFGYAGSDRRLFESFSMSVAPGERVALMAPSGSGKTTLCRLLAGYERPQQGGVFVEGKPLLRAGALPVQLILQHPELAVDPRMRMVDVLEEAGGAFADLRRRLKSAGGGLGHADLLLDGLGIKRTWLTRFPHELSGGELQRFCIARALASGPRFLVADEISTMLDAVTQALIWDYLVDVLVENDMGLVFVSHSPALVERLATRVIKLG